MDGVAELALIVEQALQAVETLAGAVLDERPPQVDELLRRRRRRLPGKPLAHHHGDGLLDRRVGAVGDLVELAAVEAVVDHRGEIVLHAEHAARADRLDASLLDGVEHRAGLLAAGHQAPMHRRIVAGELERDGIGMAAHDRGLATRELSRRLGQPHLAADQAGPLGRERHFKLGLARDGAQTARHRALERLGRRFLALSLRLLVGGHRSCRLLRYPLPLRERVASEASRVRGPSLSLERPLTRTILALLGSSTLSRKGRG